MSEIKIKSCTFSLGMHPVRGIEIRPVVFKHSILGHLYLFLYMVSLDAICNIYNDYFIVIDAKNM